MISFDAHLPASQCVRACRGKALRQNALRVLAACVLLFPNASPVFAAGKPSKSFELTRAEDFPVEGILPAPPTRGSDVDKLELGFLHNLIAGASPERLEQARLDDAHEDPSIFNQAMGVDLKTLPATWALLHAVQNDADLAGDILKAHFDRTRPWGIDPTLANCDAGKGKKPGHGYPSGHATLGFSVGLVLANLSPSHAAAVLGRARDYGLSREICGVHFPSDIEASHAIGSIVATRILTNPAAAARIAAARAELSQSTRP